MKPSWAPAFAVLVDHYSAGATDLTKPVLDLLVNVQRHTVADT